MQLYIYYVLFIYGVSTRGHYENLKEIIEPSLTSGARVTSAMTVVGF